MADVKLTLEEFDNLRKTIKNQEETIEHFKSLNKDLTSKSRVIIKSQYIDLNQIQMQYNWILSRPTRVNRYGYNEPELLTDDLYKIIKNPHIGESTQYVNFDDIKNQVEQNFIQEFNDLKIKREEEIKRLNYKYKITHQTEIDKLKQKLNGADLRYDNLQKSFNKLQEDNRQLNRSQNDKIHDAELKLALAQKELDELLNKPPKKGFFKRIFN